MNLSAAALLRQTCQSLRDHSDGVSLVSSFSILPGGAGGLELKQKIQDQAIMGCPKFEPRPVFQ